MHGLPSFEGAICVYLLRSTTKFRHRLVGTRSLMVSCRSFLSVLCRRVRCERPLFSDNSHNVLCESTFDVSLISSRM